MTTKEALPNASSRVVQESCNLKKIVGCCLQNSICFQQFTLKDSKLSLQHFSRNYYFHNMQHLKSDFFRANLLKTLVRSGEKWAFMYKFRNCKKKFTSYLLMQWLIWTEIISGCYFWFSLRQSYKSKFFPSNN